MRLEVLMFLWEQAVARLGVLIYKEICQGRWEGDSISDSSGKPRFLLSRLAPGSEFSHSRLLCGLGVNYKLDKEMPESALLLFC